jgi:putative ABC transport system permease protein
MVQFSFLLESSFVALLGIGIGVALGVSLAYQIVPETGVEGLNTVIPWARIGLITGIAYLASLTTTFLPARQAARVYPAEALRYY